MRHSPRTEANNVIAYNTVQWKILSKPFWFVITFVHCPDSLTNVDCLTRVKLPMKIFLQISTFLADQSSNTNIRSCEPYKKDVNPLCKKLCCKFNINLEAFWQYKPKHLKPSNSQLKIIMKDIIQAQHTQQTVLRRKGQLQLVQVEVGV